MNVPTEKAFYDTIRGWAVKVLCGFKIERIENGVGVGTPDVHGIFNHGRPVWIELKTAREPAKSDSKLFGTRARGLTKEQENWLLEYSNHGGSGFTCICTDKRVILISGDRARIVNESSVTELCNESDYWSYRKDIDAKEFFECLC